MSSIIKSGSAPSNTPDGKYFLQTDQACYAELKRGRTYIMTAQEVSKVSHYVIITNADFTVTFNGDSDLVQCGISNNAIVMMVHRACRIDFTQGGNLEFKEGTAEFSSRIEMGVNASGNVLVASTLPQQGDFAGQICSLTTGATYVWTGSQWSSTAGSSTLPTPTSANKYYGLMSNGTSWEANKAIYANYRDYGSTTITAGIYLIPLCKFNESTVHYAADIQLGQHERASTKIHVDVTALYGTIHSGRSQLVMFGKDVATDNSAPLVDGLYLSSTIVSGSTLYIGIMSKTSERGIRCTIWNRVVDYGTAEPTSMDMIALTTETKLTSVTKYVSVPVSTAANQMLVSDGNGGWTTALHPTHTIQALTDGVMVTEWNGYAYKKIASHSTLSGHSGGQLGIDYTFGVHGTESYNGKIKITILANSTNQYSGMTVMEYPAYPVETFSYIGNARYLSKDIALSIGLVYNSSANTVDVYFIAKTTNAQTLRYVPRFTFDNIIGDEDWVYSTTKTWDGENEASLPSGIVMGNTSVYMVPPVTTTDDNGKVLKVVNGVPTWTSA